jgi:hypothetical protein
MVTISKFSFSTTHARVPGARKIADSPKETTILGTMTVRSAARSFSYRDEVVPEPGLSEWNRLTP